MKTVKILDVVVITTEPNEIHPLVIGLAKVILETDYPINGLQIIEGGKLIKGKYPILHLRLSRI